jgi:hypothetical protein
MPDDFLFKYCGMSRPAILISLTLPRNGEETERYIGLISF